MTGPRRAIRQAGRSIAVTGMGVVTSLGVGKSDNWAKLTAGASGIRRISRFPTRQPHAPRSPARSTTCISDYMPPAELSERIALLAGEEAIAESGIGRKGHFPGPLFLALPPLEIEWPYRFKMAETAAPTGEAGYPDLVRVAREPQFAPIYGHAQIRHHRRASRRAFRHRRLADLADDRVRLRRDARSSSASKRSGAANARRRWRSAPTVR